LSPDPKLDYLFRAGSIERYISKRTEFDLTFDLDRTAIALHGFDETRVERTRIDGTPLPDESQSGGDASVTWKFGAKTNIGLGGKAIKRTFDDGRGSDLAIVSLSGGYKLGTRTDLTMKFEKWRESSDAISGPNYNAKVISASVARTLR
jgi:uncharacterized protein (PEP-CTERM system associated)